MHIGVFIASFLLVYRNQNNNTLYYISAPPQLLATEVRGCAVDRTSSKFSVSKFNTMRYAIKVQSCPNSTCTFCVSQYECRQNSPKKPWILQMRRNQIEHVERMELWPSPHLWLPSPQSYQSHNAEGKLENEYFYQLSMASGIHLEWKKLPWSPTGHSVEKVASTQSAIRAKSPPLSLRVRRLNHIPVFLEYT